MDMLTTMRLRLWLPVLLISGLLLAFSPTGVAQTGGSSAPAQAPQTQAPTKTQAPKAPSLQTGIGDESSAMFNDPLWRRLHTEIARYIVPYDAVVRPYSLRLAAGWIRAAEVHNQQVLVAFYHSEYTPTRMPSVAAYERDVKRFIKLFPYVRQYQPWNEANRGRIRYPFEALDSPSAVTAAKYYKALKDVCRGCTVTGLDLLDQPNVSPSLSYLAAFKREIRHLRTPMPTLWGLHNYSDTNHFESRRTRAILRAVRGQVWLTETGGVVRFAGLTNNKGAGLTRAARALSYMFKLASSIPRIKRLYIYSWRGGTARAIFDAGLMDAHHKPRPGYVVVCRRLHAANCHVKVSNR